jgi:hypothetical protein
LEPLWISSVMRITKNILKSKDLKNYGAKRWIIIIHFYNKLKVNLMLDCQIRKSEQCKKKQNNFRGSIYNILKTDSWEDRIMNICWDKVKKNISKLNKPSSKKHLPSKKRGISNNKLK